MALSVSLIAFLTYRDILGYFFTGMDAIPLIDSSRIQSFRDVVRIFSEPGLKAFPDALNFHKWYRPVTVLSYGIDYSIWKLNPFGYHLTDLILHSLVSISVYFLIRLLTHGKHVTAWIGAFIFTTHPLLVEGIPANVRRFDTLTALFVLFSLLLFLKYFIAKNHNKNYLFFSVFFYAFAIGAKEIAIILPLLIIAYIIIFNFTDEQSFKCRVNLVLKTSLPYFIITFIYLAVRIYVLGGIGGYADKPHGIFAVFPLLSDICVKYFWNLVYPVDFLHLNSLFKPLQSIFTQIGLLIIFFIFTCFIIIYNLNKIKEYFRTSTYGRVIIFLLIWLILPLSVYLLTFISGRYYLYISVIPFSMILSIITVESFKTAVQKIKEHLFPDTPFTSAYINSKVMKFTVMASLIFSLLAYSPLIRTYGEWKDTGYILERFFHKLSKIIPELPNDAVIHIYNFPNGIVSYETRIPHAEEVEYPTAYGIKSWLDLNYPTNHIKVVIHGKSLLKVYPNSLDLEIKREKDNNVVIIVKYKGDTST